MSSCRDVTGFLQGVETNRITARLPEGDLATLQQLNLLQLLTQDQYQRLAQEVSGLSAAQASIQQESVDRARLLAAISEENRKTHSILFHFEGERARQKEAATLTQEQGQLQALEGDLTVRERAFSELLSKQALLQSARPYDQRYIALTGLGRLALHELGVRLYRVGDQDFRAYWTDAQKVDAELQGIATTSAGAMAPLVASLPTVDRSYLWAVTIGMAKAGGDVGTRVQNFLRAFAGVASLSPNEENRLMSAEVLSAFGRPIDPLLQTVQGLNSEVRTLGVPAEASLGVASILLMGQRQDGSFAVPNLQFFLRQTPSFEAAALLSVVNRPSDQLTSRFYSVRTQFLSWGNTPSEDVELSSSYLATSDLPLETVSPKLAIISRGLAAYLQYPLVASAILASIPVLEANETLSLVEKAYEILGQRTGPLSQSELVCLAVRMIHGIQVRSVDELDTTAAKAPVAPQPPGFQYGPYPVPLWLPMIVVHGGYYSTFSGMGGPHPGHVHTIGGGGGWGGGFGG